MIPNLTLALAAIGALLQAGAQLFAVAVVVATVTQAPPRSLAMYAGEYGYNSAPFWEIVPIVALLLMLGARLSRDAGCCAVGAAAGVPAPSCVPVLHALLGT